MPKEIYNQTDFSGGINGIDSPRDVLDTQVIRASSVTFDEKGRIRMMGKAGITPIGNDDGKEDNGFVDGTGFFYFTHDYEMFDTGSVLINDPEYKESEYYAYSNQNHISIWQGAPVNRWYSTIIYTRPHTQDDPVPAASRIVQFYFADAALRCYNATLSDRFSPTWFGHVKRGLFKYSGKQINLNEWYKTTTKLMPPIGNIGYNFQTTGGEQPGRNYWVNETNTTVVMTTATRFAIHLTAHADGGVGTWLANTYRFHLSYIYDGSQESPVGTDGGPGIAGDTQSSYYNLAIAAGATLWIGCQYNAGTSYGFDHNVRITGCRLYYSDPVDGRGTKYHLMDIDFREGCRKFDETDYTVWHEDDATNGDYECPKGLIGTTIYGTAGAFEFEDMPKSITYDMLNGYGPTEVTDAKFKCHTVFNNRVWVGNIKQDGITYSDRIIRSPINFEGNPQYDTFPATHKMDVAANDGDAVMALEGYGDRLLVFKKQSVYVINVAGDGGEFVETKFTDLGVLGPSQVAATEHGVVWINDKGCYLYTGKEQPINLVDNIFSSKEGRLITPDMKWHIAEDKHPCVVYLPRDNKLLVSLGMAVGYSNDIYLFDFVKKAWSFGSSVLADYTLKRTNFIINAQGEALFAELDPAGSGNTLTTYKWDDTAKAQSNFQLWFKDLDFEQPNIRKKFYKMYLSFRASSTTNVVASFTTNGNYGQTLDFQTLTGIDNNNMLEHSATYATLVSNGDFLTGTGKFAVTNDIQTELLSTSWYTTHVNSGATIIIYNGSMTWDNNNSPISDLILYEDIAVDDGTSYEVSFTANTASADFPAGSIVATLPQIMCYITKANSATIGTANHAGLTAKSNMEGFVVSKWTGTYRFSFTADEDANWYVAFRSVILTNPALPDDFDSYTAADSPNQNVLLNQVAVSNVSVKQFDEWRRAELKPTTSSEANNIYSVGLRLDAKKDGSGNNLTVPSDFEIDNLSVVYRKKNIK
tara:strand:- start:5301 stop:8240 length:2940 start_codon:yes stop_codon:yes gene_type:complete